MFEDCGFDIYESEVERLQRYDEPELNAAQNRRLQVSAPNPLYY